MWFSFFELPDLILTLFFSFDSLEIFALFMLTGIFSTLLIPETNQKSLEELSNERKDEFIDGTFYPGLAFEGALTAYMSQGVHMMRKLRAD